MCCSWWHYCYRSFLAIIRKKIGELRKEIRNLNGFKYRYLNGLKLPYYSTYPPLSIKVTSMCMTQGLVWGARGPFPPVAAMVGYGCVG